MNKERILNSICATVIGAQSGTLKFGTSGFVDFTITWSYKLNFDIFNAKTKVHYFCGSLDRALQIVEKLLTEI